MKKLDFQFFKMNRITDKKRHQLDNVEFIHPQRILYVHVHVESLDTEAWNNVFVLLKR
jgi:hypothetical protein